MNNAEKYDFVVIGSGILALSTAFRLKQRDRTAKIVLIGPDSDQHSATRCAGAMINVFAEIPFNGFEYDSTAQKLKILIEAEKLWDEFCEELGSYADSYVPKPMGQTHVILNSRSTPTEVNTFNYIQNWLKLNSHVEELNPKDVPGLKATDYGFPMRAMTLRDRHVNPVAIMNALIEGHKKNGVEIISDRVKAIKKSGIGGKSKIAYVTTCQDQKIQGAEFIFANGFDPYNDFSSELGILPIFANGGCALHLTKPEWVKRKGGLGSTLDELNDVIRMVDRGGACGIHIVPQGDGSFYLGASSAVWTNPEYTPKLAATQVLINSAMNEINYELWHYDVKLIGNGFRPCTPDAMPIIGKTKLKNAYCLNGFKRDGFTASPHASNLIVEAIEKNKNPMSIFEPTRKLISYKSRNEAIADALEVSSASMYQHYQHIAPLKKEVLSKSDQEYILACHKRVPGQFGIHPEMLHLYADKEFFVKFKKHL